MDRNFKIAHRMAAGQVAHRIAGQEQDRSRLAGIRVPASASLAVPKYLMLLLLGRKPAEIANQYINTTKASWLEPY